MPIKLVPLFCALLYCSQLAAKPLYEKWQSIDYIQKAFLEVALKNEFNPSHQQLIRWQKPIHYSVEFLKMPPNPLINNLITAQLKHLQKITKHPIQPSQTTANLNIIFTQGNYYATAIKRFTQSAIKNLAQDSNCMGSFQVNRRSEITHATVIIPVDRVMGDGLLVACIVEETTQIMGLPNDSDWVFPSIANDKSKIELLTGLDYILLKLLYSEALSPGMKAQQIQPIIKKMLIKWEKNRTIKRAPFIVNRSGLYPLVN
ncbi:hypothetical protein CYQ88_08925 [Hydrogenovibrio sp. SC-1]|uniref:DUF2927 domain-containing protein n=1 Tax=Hydrogenovibrio sp. SC-1 TaxID=2065820 RepID=UPI000C7E4232|nr:DUF2927 domain-containing protein [Hydrogenovibrio sp. SC-1]PLA73840.1 hypothetical protein CYQ88_08925 [Hydrogenovibrio sp. SC-1]